MLDTGEKKIDENVSALRRFAVHPGRQVSKEELSAKSDLIVNSGEDMVSSGLDSYTGKEKEFRT